MSLNPLAGLLHITDPSGPILDTPLKGVIKVEDRAGSTYHKSTAVLMVMNECWKILKVKIKVKVRTLRGLYMSCCLSLSTRCGKLHNGLQCSGHAGRQRTCNKGQRTGCRGHEVLPFA